MTSNRPIFHFSFLLLTSRNAKTDVAEVGGGEGFSEEVMQGCFLVFILVRGYHSSGKTAARGCCPCQRHNRGDETASNNEQGNNAVGDCRPLRTSL
jgi:hypothetical protein